METKKHKTKIISVASQKGGTGKTTCSITIAAGLAKLYNQKVLLIDTDPQANSSKILCRNYESIEKENTLLATIMDKKKLEIHKTNIKNLDIVPSHLLLSGADIELAQAIDPRANRLERQLEKVKQNYDYIIIDCPPSLSWLFINALTASTDVIIMVDVGYFSLDAITQILKTIKEVKNFYNNKLFVMGMLYNMSDNTIASKNTFDILKTTWPKLLLPFQIPRNTDIRDSQLSKKTIWDYSINCHAANAYKKVIFYILEQTK